MLEVTFIFNVFKNGRIYPMHRVLLVLLSLKCNPTQPTNFKMALFLTIILSKLHNYLYLYKDHVFLIEARGAKKIIKINPDQKNSRPNFIPTTIFPTKIFPTNIFPDQMNL